MANLSISTEVNNNNNNNDDKSHVTVDIQAAEITGESYKTRRQRILHRVPAHLRENKNHIYDPMVLSLGAYHHNRRSKQFFRVEELKTLILNNTLDSSTKGLLYSKILERADEIRIFYGGLSIDEYKDEALAEVLLRDACFLLYYMELANGDNEKKSHLFGRLGLSVAVFLDGDYFMLENQIPFWVIKLFITLKSNDKDEGEGFLRKFLSYICFADPEILTRLPWGKDHEPLHLLEAHRKTFIFKEDTGSEIEHRGSNIFELIKWRRTGSTNSTQSSTNFELGNGMFRSVTDLKAKGIHFRPSSYCLKDIRFNSYAFYGKLMLPRWFVNNNTKAFFSNMIALEMLPETDTNFDVLSYVNFMKSLLETPKDVKELREKGILFSSLRNDGEVLKVFKEIDTYGVNNEEFFFDVKMRINEHCDSKAKTWIAELIHTYFRNPWTAIALFAAVFLLFLTFLQTYYTMDPKKSN